MSVLPKLVAVNTAHNRLIGSNLEEEYNPLQRTYSNCAVRGINDSFELPHHSTSLGLERSWSTEVIPDFLDETHLGRKAVSFGGGETMKYMINKSFLKSTRERRNRKRK